MKKETLDAAVGMLSEDLLEETNKLRKVKEALTEQKKTGKSWKIWKSYMPLAAAALLLCLTGVWYGNRQKLQKEGGQTVADPSTEGELAENDSMENDSMENDSMENDSMEKGVLPKLEITENSGESMGFEGYLAYEISELVNENPWREEMNLTTLPVYRNHLSYNQYGKVIDPDLQAMEKLLKELAGKMGLDVNQLEITNDVPEGEKRDEILEKIGEEDSEDYFIPFKLTAKADGMSIEVDATMTAEIWFEPARELPEGYHYTFRDSSYEEIASAAEYLGEQYQGLLGMEKPVRKLSGGDYTYAGRKEGRLYHIGFYDGSGDALDQILQYHFYPVQFSCDEEGRLSLIRFYHPDLPEQVGDYPIVSVKEAEKLLENGNYITSVPEKMPGLKYVSKVELTYRTGTHETYYMPYYRFYVELPGYTYEDGLKTYGAYYVPAVKSEYLVSMPVWDGSFD